MLNRLLNRIQFLIFPTKTGRNLTINGTVYRRGRGMLTIGDRVTINSSKRSNLLGGKDYTTLCVQGGAELTIGNDVGISNATLICCQQITIGDHAMLGGDCKLYDSDFHALDPNLRGNGELDVAKTAPIIIDENAFIGAHCIILKGVHIGKCSVVGAGSVVTKDIPAGEVWAGNPARFIRKL